MRYGDLLAKLAGGDKLSPGEQDELRLQGNRQESIASQVAKWGTPDGNLDLSFLPIRVIYSKQLSIDTPSIVIDVPPDINNIIMFGMARSDDNSFWDPIGLRLNADTAANYETEVLEAYAAAPDSLQSLAYDSFPIGGAPASSAAANFAGYWFAVLPNIQAGFFKGGIAIGGGRWNATTAYLGVSASWWESTARLKTLTFFPYLGTNFLAGTSVTVLGVT